MSLESRELKNKKSFSDYREDYLERILQKFLFKKVEKDHNTETKRCFATHDEDIDYFNMRIYIILIACVYIQQFNFVQ